MVVNPLTNDYASSTYGIPMTEEAFEHLISLESPYRYELIDGLVYDMTGFSPEEETIKLDQLDLELPLVSVYEGMF